MIIIKYFRHFEIVHNIFRPSGKYLKGFSSHDRGKTYAPEFLSYSENEPSLKRKRSDSDSSLHDAKKQNEPSQSGDETEANRSVTSDVEDSELKTEASQSSDEGEANKSDTSNGDGGELKIESPEENEIDTDAIIEKLNDEFNKAMGNQDDFEHFFTSTKSSRRLLNEFEMCSLSGTENENMESAKGC